ncbi:hypothetical protein [Brevibacillus sp. BC25]|nr:hypothetical protein [Brevibacillus sp. BC25]
MSKLPSFTAMTVFATQDTQVKREGLAELSDDFAGTEAERQGAGG